MEINKALLSDAELQSVYNHLCEIKNEIENALLEPSSSTVLSILNYSRSIEQKK
jgi:hypothetical protein